MSQYKTLYTVGYTGIPVADLKRVVEELDAILVDIRYSPFSMAPVWRKGKLRETFGDWEHNGRYAHIPALGNENYKKPEKGIQIKDMGEGLDYLEQILLRQPAMLMCACVDFQHCHRLTVANAAAERFGFNSTIHLSKEAFKQGKKPKGTKDVQLGLFEEK